MGWCALPDVNCYWRTDEYSEDQLESAKMDGAKPFQIFTKITMPYMLFITGRKHLLQTL